jgi:integrase/recombinase XerD
VRRFARYRALVDPATEIPPAGLLGRLPRRQQPHVYSDVEIAALLDQASLLLPRRGLRPRTYVAFFSLLACTGLRLSEACRLTVQDVDLNAGVLTVREALR